MTHNRDLKCAVLLAGGACVHRVRDMGRAYVGMGVGVVGSEQRQGLGVGRRTSNGLIY